MGGGQFCPLRAAVSIAVLPAGQADSTLPSPLAATPHPQCAGTQPSSIWPLEDAVEFQGVAAELRSAAAGGPRAMMQARLPLPRRCAAAQHTAPASPPVQPQPGSTCPLPPHPSLPAQAWLRWECGCRRTWRRTRPTCTASSWNCPSLSTSFQARWRAQVGASSKAKQQPGCCPAYDPRVTIARWPSVSEARTSVCKEGSVEACVGKAAMQTWM